MHLTILIYQLWVVIDLVTLYLKLWQFGESKEQDNAGWLYNLSMGNWQRIGLSSMIKSASF